MISLIKMSIKLLLRNKGFLFFLIATPAVSSFILNMKVDHAVYTDSGNTPAIIELDDCTEKAVYVGDTSAFIVKVYDASLSELSEYVLEKIAETGMFSVCRCDVSDRAEEEILAQAKKDAFDDRAGMLLYLKKDFEQAVLKGNWESGMQLYAVSEDERQTLFEAELENVLMQIKQVQMLAGENSKEIIVMLKAITEGMPEKQIVSLAGKKDIRLTDEQINQKTQIGYAFAIITLGFLFCGVCVAHTVIEEQNNKVFTRMMLSRVSEREYFFSKFVVVFAISIMQTLVLSACLSVIKDVDFGINRWSFLLVIFLLGLIFSTLSLLTGVLIGDVMSSNYAVFSIWSISALLAGLYFPLDDTGAALKTLSYLMPQRWFMKVSEMLLIQDRGAYSMLLYVTGAYLIIIISLGSVGLKMKRSEA
ncbi:MAG: ABC transporter permease [Lachnospiraceae bacterium]|nr:ABC transporter permease [Lachnospiraceae bacterium]